MAANQHNLKPLAPSQSIYRSTAASSGVYSSSGPCEERQQLAKVYLDVVRTTAVDGVRILNVKSKAWREATKETRVACDVALADLNQHMREHGC
jgi:hypothetical protein